MKRLLMIIAASLMILTACSSGKKTLEDDIVGKWVNDAGYTIEFYDGGTGFIEGFGEVIPDTTFVYTVLNESSIQISYEGGTYDIDIQIDDDKLIWKDKLGEVTYSRVR